MKTMLNLVLTNIVVSGVAVWGYVIGYESAAVAASVMLWVVSVVGILAGIFSDNIKDDDYEPRGFIHFTIAIVFDVANAGMVIYSGRPMLGAIILISSALSAVYIQKKNKLTKSRGLCDN